ncbi:MAG: nucleotidyl transferase AbiEii/AbiGii toxin family protein [Micrococcales bacterium]|nr:nucleotidyl transferase AbiEii/AbiGii toxin family protein [Micrococcales bacterium]
MNTTLATARLRIHVDINVGDPIWPEPTRVSLPRLRGGNPIELAGYPLHMVYAEKIITAMQRGTANTRWRDFGDVYTLMRQHPIDGTALHRACAEVATHRKVTVEPLGLVLDGYAELAQARWAMWRRRGGFDHLPQDFATVLAAVIAFAHPPLAGEVDGLSWDPSSLAWQ